MKLAGCDEVKLVLAVACAKKLSFSKGKQKLHPRVLDSAINAFTVYIRILIYDSSLNAVGKTRAVKYGTNESSSICFKFDVKDKLNEKNKHQILTEG